MLFLLVWSGFVLPIVPESEASLPVIWVPRSRRPKQAGLVQNLYQGAACEASFCTLRKLTKLSQMFLKI